MKLLAVLMVLVSWLFSADSVAAESWSKRLIPKETADQMYSFTIKVDRLKETELGEFLQFNVTVKPAASAAQLEEASKHGWRPLYSGELRVFDGKKFISACNVQPTRRDAELSFSFQVAAEYADKSSFTFAQTEGEEGGVISYWFYLGDFVEAGNPSKTIGRDMSQALSDDERLALLKPVMTLPEVERLWQGKTSIGQTCGEGVNKLTGETGGVYGDVYLLKLSSSSQTQSMKFHYFQGEDGGASRLFEFQGPGFHYYLKDGKYAAVKGPPKK